VGEIEALYTETDPALVSFLLDAGHAYRGGAAVPAFLRKHHDRIIALHLRDYSNGQQVPLGQGSFPLAEVAATLKHLNWQGWALNEEEREDGSKLGPTVMEPAFAALQKPFPQ
jgi:inosose dehydratase